MGNCLSGDETDVAGLRLDNFEILWRNYQKIL